MLNYIKNNFAVIMLLLIVIAGLGYPFYSGRSFMAPRLSEIDRNCYGVDVPDTIKHRQVLLFCSCIHTVSIENRAEKYHYCTTQVNKS